MSANLGECSNRENFVSDHVEEIEYDFDTFDNFEKMIKKFEQLQKISNCKYLNRTQKIVFILQFSTLLSMHCSRKKKILSSVKTKGSLPGFWGKAFLKSLRARGKVFS